jgi:hypothetical protein
MAILVTCSCGKKLKVKDDLAGKRIKCPTCMEPLIVPAGGADEPYESASASTDEGEPRPRRNRAKAAKSSNTLLFVCIGAGVLLMSCCCLGAVGTAVFYMMQSADAVASSKKLPAPPVVELGRWTALDAKYEPIQGGGANPAKSYTIPLKANKTYLVELVRTGGTCDPYLVIEDSSGKRLAQDDDGGGFPDAKLLFTPSRDDDYRIFAITIAGPGEFALRVNEQNGAKQAGKGGPAKGKGKG